MIDYSKPQPCGECGKMVRINEKHTFQDCQEWKWKLDAKKFNNSIKEKRRETEESGK